MTQMTTGEYLRQTREAKGYRLEDVAAAINVRRGQLKAIEDGDISQLPGLIYAVGFVKSYAQFLGVDAKAVSAHFKKEHEKLQKEETKPSKNFAPDPHRDNRIPTIGIVLSAIIFLAISFFLWMIFRTDTANELSNLTEIPPVPDMVMANDVIGEDEFEHTNPSQPEQAQSDHMEAPWFENDIQDGHESEIGSDVVTENLTIEMDQAELAQSENIVDSAPSIALQNRDQLQPSEMRESRIRIVAAQTGWLEIMEPSRRSLYKGLLREGDEYNVPPVSEIILSTGNAGGLIFYVDGKKLLPIGQSGDILREIRITADHLLQEYTPR